jgi:predicted O-methyltransferase YrrM
MTKNKEQYQDPVDEISGGYRASQVLLTANRLGVFSALGSGAMTLDNLAETLGADQRGTRILCDALVAISLLEKEGETYKNTLLAMEYLTPGAPRSKIAMLRHTARLYERWGKLYDVVKNGHPAPDDAVDSSLQEDERDFALAMADAARVSARQTAEMLDLSGAAKMLDVGGGPGLYAIEFARQNPKLYGVVFDNEKTVRVAQANIEQAGLSDRISVRTGDAYKDDLGDGYDFILLSNVIHSYSYEDNSVLVSRCAGALTRGGRLCVKDFLLDPDRTSPAWASLFAVNMLVNTESGDCYTVDEVAEWFHRAGLVLDKAMDLTAQSRLVIGRK